jgi:hypothetical protein
MGDCATGSPREMKKQLAIVCLLSGTFSGLAWGRHNPFVNTVMTWRMARCEVTLAQRGEMATPGRAAAISSIRRRSGKEFFHNAGPGPNLELHRNGATVEIVSTYPELPDFVVDGPSFRERVDRVLARRISGFRIPTKLSLVAASRDPENYAPSFSVVFEVNGKMEGIRFFPITGKFGDSVMPFLTPGWYPCDGNYVLDLGGRQWGDVQEEILPLLQDAGFTKTQGRQSSYAIQVEGDGGIESLRKAVAGFRMIVDPAGMTIRSHQRTILEF